MTTGRSYLFTSAITRLPAASVTRGLRDGSGPAPSAELFLAQHTTYVSALKSAGVRVDELPPLEDFPDSVFVEDSAICLKDAAIVLRPGAPSRRGEVASIKPVLQRHFSNVLELTGGGFVDGGDVLLTDSEAFIGLSSRTNQAGLDELASILAEFSYATVTVRTPPSILHFKTECGLLDSSTIFCTRKLASLGCFSNYTVIEVPVGEEGAANIVRMNELVFISGGYPQSEALLTSQGYNVHVLDTSEPAKVDGGLSCMSLRF